MIGIFNGIRVIELAQAIAATWSTRILASQGAEVISVEFNQRPNIMRGNPFILPSMAWYPEYGMMKLSLSLDLHHPEGRRIMMDLLKTADVFFQNFSPEAIGQFGLDEPSVRAINSDIIYVGQPGVGSYGPYKDFSAFGIAIQGMTGMNYLMGYPNEGPIGPPIARPDYAAGVYGAFIAAAALDYRRRTHQGLSIEMSLYEAMASCLGTTTLEYRTNNRVPTRNGNRDPHAAPHGIYRCQGEDRWCAIAVFTDEEWRAFCEVVGRPPWTADARFATLEARKENEDELDRLVEEWTVHLDPWDVMYQMQKAGVPAGVSETGSDSELGRDVHLKRREFMEQSFHPELGNHPSLPVPIRFSESRGRFGGTPDLGEHRNYVCKMILGMTDEEIQRLADEGVFG